METIRTPPEFQWWKPEASDSAETSVSWQARELTLDADQTLVLDSDPPAQDEFPEFLYD